MKLERLPEYFISFIVILLGLAIALYVGLNAGSGSLQSIVLIVGGLCFLIIGAVMGRYVWLLIPLSLHGPGKILDLPIGMLEAASLTAFAWWVIFAAFRKVPFRTPINAGDILLFLNLCYLVLCFARNPVGGMLLNSERIGGRPYFSVIFACMAYWVLSRVNLDALWARRVPWLTVIGALPALAATVLSKLIPGLAPFFNYVLGTGGVPNGEDGGSRAESEKPERLGYLFGPIAVLITTTVARLPAKTFINPLYFWRCLFLFIALTLGALSGFRSLLVAMAAYFLLIAWYQRCLAPVIRTTLIALPVIALLIAGHGTLYEFPWSIQRSLSFLPGKWDSTAVILAEDSTEWRQTLWSMLLSDKEHLQNRWLGDGFGYSANEHQALIYDMLSGKGREAEYLYFVTIGMVHSGPLSLLRFVGYVGGVLFYTLLIYNAVSAHRLIRKALGTPYQFVSLALCVPIVFSPFFFTFLYGALETDYPRIVISLGLLNMIGRGLDRYLREQKALAALPPEGAGKALTAPASS